MKEPKLKVLALIAESLANAEVVPGCDSASTLFRSHGQRIGARVRANRVDEDGRPDVHATASRLLLAGDRDRTGVAGILHPAAHVVAREHRRNSCHA
jgi:hypothetical protein